MSEESEDKAAEALVNETEVVSPADVGMFTEVDPNVEEENALQPGDSENQHEHDEEQESGVVTEPPRQHTKVASKTKTTRKSGEGSGSSSGKAKGSKQNKKYTDVLLHEIFPAGDYLYLRIQDKDNTNKLRLPIEEARQKKNEDMEEKSWNRLKLILKKLIEHSANAICPADPKILAVQTAEEICGKVSKKSRKGAKQGEGTGFLKRELCKGMLAARKGSVVKRVCRALLCSGMSHKKLNIFLEENFGASMSKGSHQAGRADWKLIEAGQEVVVEKHSCQRFNMESVQKAVDFILLGDYVQYLPWETKLIKLGLNDSLILPAITRKLSPTELWDLYKKEATDKSDRISKTSFFDIVNEVSVTEDMSQRVSDESLAKHLYDNMRTVRRVIKDFVADKGQRESMLKQVDVIVYFLRDSYHSHLDKNDECATHNIAYALGTEGAETVKPVDCTACKYPFYFMDVLLRQAEHWRGGELLPLLKQSRDKLKKYMGQQVRNANSNANRGKEIGRSPSKKRKRETEEEVQDQGKAKNMVACAIRYALQLISRERNDVSFALTTKESDFDYSEASEYNLDLSEFVSSWAKRPTRGSRNGAGKISFYEDDIRQIFESSIKEKILRSKSLEVLDVLQNKYPDRYDIPSLSAIKYELTRIYSRSQKNSKAMKGDMAESKKKSRHGMANRYTDYIDFILKSHPDITGKPAVKLFMENFKNEDESDLPSDKQIQTKLNSLKQSQGKKQKEEVLALSM
uniref:Uncharacterized protein n=1 Tax=Aplanochytrium stocchinoi TaxID=215587 RepID=A0A7S3PQN3_9STRA|mmetsp:Transcript_24718/g.30272  ORF Transcript_24718/g.30272 Transcript_24718/m.30272 type:complete len:744 (+) Transcript_24718:18-2249(+)